MTYRAAGPPPRICLTTFAASIEFGGAVIVTVAVFRALVGLMMGSTIDRARLIMIAGSLSALGYKSAATLLKAIELGSWRGIGSFAAIFALRTIIKQMLTGERSRLMPSRSVPNRSGVLKRPRR